MRNTSFILLFIPIICLSQNNNLKLIEGTVYNDDSYSIEGVHVLNITSNYNTITDSEGNFKIYADLNDEIIFSAIQFKRKKIIINDDLLNSISIKVFLEEFETLEEAKEKYPKAEQTSFINPVITTNHLPDYEMNSYEEENYWYDNYHSNGDDY